MPPAPLVPSPRALARLRSPGPGPGPGAGESRSDGEVDLGGSPFLPERPVRRPRPVEPDPPSGPTRQERAVDVPVVLLQGRWGVSRRAVLGVLLVGLVAVLVFGARVLLSDVGEPATIPVGGGLVQGRGTASADRSRSAGPTGSGRVSASEPPSAAAGRGGVEVTAAGGTGVVVVHVVGRVRHPGLFTLAGGARVADAVKAAGGPATSADLAAINLARLLVDGEQVRVPAVGDVPAAGTAGASPGAGVGGGSPALVPLNTADAAALDTLPGVGPVLAQRILDWRTAHGRFTSVDELGEVSGIGEALLGRLKDRVTL